MPTSFNSFELLATFCTRRAAKQASFISVIISFESCTECKILFKLAGLFGHGHAINEPLIDNNFYEYFLQFYGGVIDENFMSHCQGNTQLEYHGSVRVQLYLLTSIDR